MRGMTNSTKTTQMYGKGTRQGFLESNHKLLIQPIWAALTRKPRNLTREKTRKSIPHEEGGGVVWNKKH